MNDQRLHSFLKSVRNIEWFSNAGNPFQDARVVDGMQNGWDHEGARMLDLWGQQTRALERHALESLTNQELDEIFCAVAEAIDESLYNGICNYLDRAYRGGEDAHKRAFDEGVFPEVVESVKRDACWAGVEYVIQVHGFFSMLLDLYRRGRWVCSWDGNYPKGQPVIL